MNKDEILSILKEKGVINCCPMCEKNNLSLYDDVFCNKFYEIREDKKIYPIDEDLYFPTIVITCENCGFLSQHAVGVIKRELIK